MTALAMFLCARRRIGLPPDSPARRARLAKSPQSGQIFGLNRRLSGRCRLTLGERDGSELTFIGRSGIMALASVPALAAGAARAAEDKPHRLVIHVGGGDAGQMNVALTNTVNAIEFYAKIGKTIAIELVANGPDTDVAGYFRR